MKAESCLTYHLAFIRGLIALEVMAKEAANGVRVSSSSLSSVTLKCPYKQAESSFVVTALVFVAVKFCTG